MLNNKGFAISSVLYLLLVSFLMFLAITLAQFSASSAVIGRANDDLVDGKDLKVDVVDITSMGYDSSNWFTCPTLLRIKSARGTMYWPRDFGVTVDNAGNISNGKEYKKIQVNCASYKNCNGFNLTDEGVEEPLDIYDTEYTSGIELKTNDELIYRVTDSFVAMDEDILNDIKSKVSSIESLGLSFSDASSIIDSCYTKNSVSICKDNDDFLIKEFNTLSDGLRAYANTHDKYSYSNYKMSYSDSFFTIKYTSTYIPLIYKVKLNKISSDFDYVLYFNLQQESLGDGKYLDQIIFYKKDIVSNDYAAIGSILRTDFNNYNSSNLKVRQNKVLIGSETRVVTPIIKIKDTISGASVEVELLNPFD